MSRSRITGLAILGVLSVLDVAGPLMTDGHNPPMSVALVGSAIGLASLVCLAYVLRGARRAMLPLVILRVVSAATAVPAFLVADVSAPIRALAGGIIVLTLVGVVLSWTPQRTRAAVAS